MNLNNVEFTWIKNKPVDWKIHRVKNHFVLTKNKTENPEGYPILSLTMRGIVERDISSNEGQLPETYKGYNLLEKDDIVFNPMDLISGWVDFSPFQGLISPSYKVIRPISNEVNIKFYTYYFQTHYNEKIFFPFCEGVHYEYRWGLGTETLRNFPLLVPPLCEQKQIVSYLDTKTTLIDSLIEKTKQKIELLKEKRTSLINEAVTKGLNPNVQMKDSGVEWIGEIPSHWDRLPLKQFGQVTLGKMLTSEDKGGYHLKPYLRSQNIQVERVDMSNVKEMWFSDSELEKLKLEKGDLLFNEGGDVGRTCIWFNEIDECYIQNSVNRVRFKSDDERYFLHLSVLYHSVGYYDSLVNRVSIPHLTKEKLESVILLRPPLKEQKQIVSYLDKQTELMDNTISIEKKRIELLKEYRQSLISEVVTGKRKII